jgi:hypothetical protein
MRKSPTGSAAALRRSCAFLEFDEPRVEQPKLGGGLGLRRFKGKKSRK